MMKKKNKNVRADKTATLKFGQNLDFASSEAYKLLRTNVIFSVPDKPGGKVIGVTSPCPQEGKSTTSLNLAYSLAEAGNKVILIDADMRRPSVSKMLNMPKSPGLSNRLTNSDEKSINFGVLHENLSMMFSGEIPPNPSELISSENMKVLLEEFRKEYDYIIVDLPPVTVVSDPLVISKNIDGFAIVIRHGHTRRRDVMETMRQLKMVNAKVLGFIYNGYSKGKASYHSV
jgi:capsular exopolysaccharide synthesis family protein